MGIEAPSLTPFLGPEIGGGGKGFLHFLNCYFLNGTSWAKGPQALFPVLHSPFAPFVQNTLIEHLVCLAMC